MSAHDVSWTAFDVVKGIFALLSQDSLPASTPLLHGALYRLKECDAYKILLAGFTFEHRGHFPYCRAFHADLVSLEMSGHLSTLNPDLTEYVRKPKLQGTFNKYGKPRFSPQEMAALKCLAANFEREVQSAGTPA